MAAVDALPITATVGVVDARLSSVDVDDAHCYGGFEGDAEWEQNAQWDNKGNNSANDATTSDEPAKHAFAIETALELPFNELYVSPAELQAMPPAVAALLSGSAAAAAPFPLRIASEKIRGIAFQLWPAAKVMSKFMMQLQHDLSVADAAPLPEWMARKAAAAAAAASLSDSCSSCSNSSASTSASPSPSLSPLTSTQLPPLPPLSCSAQSGSSFWAGKKVLELGAGCGLVGMLAAALGAQVTLTDMANVVQHIQANIDLNFGSAAAADASSEAAAAPLLPVLHSRCKVAPLEWGVQPGPEFAPGSFDVILLSDCVYWEDLFTPLVTTLRALCAPSTLVLLCQSPRRPKVERRFYKQAERHFRVVLLREVAAVADCGEKKDVKLFRMQLKETTLQLPKAQRIAQPL